MLDFFNKVLTYKIHKGFKENEPINSLELDVNFIFNTKKLSDKEIDNILENYPEAIMMDFKKLLDGMFQKWKEQEGEVK